MFTLIFRNCCVSTLMQISHTLMPSEFICSFNMIRYYSWINVVWLNLPAVSSLYSMQNILYSRCSQITLCLFNKGCPRLTNCYFQNFQGYFQIQSFVQTFKFMVFPRFSRLFLGFQGYFQIQSFFQVFKAFYKFFFFKDTFKFTVFLGF